MHTLLKSRAEDPLAARRLGLDSDPVSTPPRGLSTRLRQQLLYMHVSSFDWQDGGLLTPIKFLDRDSIEYSLCRAAGKDRNEERMARISLHKGMELVDRHDGGIYQFATHNDWRHSHYSKTLAAQAGCLRLYALAHALFGEADFRTTAEGIHAYLRDRVFTAAGVFRSMSGQTVVRPATRERRAEQASTVIRTRENGWVIEALACFHEFCGAASALDMALSAASWICTKRNADAGGFSKDEGDQSSACLADHLAMARAFLQLYRASADRQYLCRAEDTANFICERYSNTSGGFNSTAGETGANPVPQVDENICLSRFLNLLHHYSGNDRYLAQARHGLAYLARPEVATARIEEAGILLLDEELASTPLTITIAGHSEDSRTRRLREAALRHFGWYKVIHCHPPQGSA